VTLVLPPLSHLSRLAGRPGAGPSPLAAVRRAVAARRRLVAALLAGLAVLCGLTALRPPAPPAVLVLAAARDLAPGSVLALADLRSVSLPAAVVPSGALRPGAAVLGRLVAGPVRSGEPLTDVRLVGPGLLSSLPAGTVAVPVRFADAGAVALLRPGDRIDVLAAPTSYAGFGDTALAAPPDPRASPAADGPGPPDPGPPDPGASGPGASVVAADVAVLVVPAADPAAPATMSADGALVVLACSPATARALASAAANGRLSPALRAPATRPPPSSPPPGR
jgi:Flp pilus assembly protein CpaB